MKTTPAPVSCVQGNKRPKLKRVMLKRIKNMGICEDKCTDRKTCVYFWWRKRGYRCYLWNLTFTYARNEAAGKANCNPITCNIQSPAITMTTKPVTTTAPTSVDCKCGLAKRAIRIVGGSTTEVNEYPWQIGLSYKTNSRVFCGGTLISDQWILTAAHCTRGDAASKLKVVLGEHDTNSNTETNSTIYLGVAKIVEHPYYSAYTYNYDFSLVKLKSKVDFVANPNIRPVCLPTSTSKDYAGEFAITTGWGAKSYGGSSSSILREVRVKVMSNKDCKASSYSSNMIKDQMICAGVQGGGKDACQGDSGGPLISLESGAGATPTQHYSLIGVVSWGYDCARPNYPGVYARTSTVLDWIESNISGSGTCPRP